MAQNARRNQSCISRSIVERGVDYTTGQCANIYSPATAAKSVRRPSQGFIRSPAVFIRNTPPANRAKARTSLCDAPRWSATLLRPGSSHGGAIINP
eukprot:scaffold401_cov399-Prasinococcus_capsulatus_cf.AAC.18